MDFDGDRRDTRETSSIYAGRRSRTNRGFFEGARQLWRQLLSRFLSRDCRVLPVSAFVCTITILVFCLPAVSRDNSGGLVSPRVSQSKKSSKVIGGLSRCTPTLTGPQEGRFPRNERAILGERRANPRKVNALDGWRGSQGKMPCFESTVIH